MSFLQPMFFLLLALSLLVLVHEWGHFWVARRLGVRVLKFSIGFGPEILGFTRGDTRYAISAIPFGGFVKFAGDNPEEELEHLPDEFLGQSVAVRSAIVLAGPVMNYVLAIFLFAAVVYFSGLETISTTRVGVVAEESLAESIGFQVDDEIRAVNGVPVADWMGFGEELVRVGASEEFEIEVERAGEPIVLRGQASDEGGFDRSPLGVAPFALATVGDVRRGGPAWNAGLRNGDRVVRLDDEEVDRWTTMAEIIRAHPSEEIEIAWERGGQTLEATVVPDAVPIGGEGGEPDTVGRIGIQQSVEREKLGVVASLGRGAERAWWLTRMVLQMLPRIPVLIFNALFQGEDEGGLGGPVRMAEIFGEAARWGIGSFILTMASISTQLAIFNLLPIPVLDGGHLALYAVEVVTRRPPSIKVKIVLQQIGFALLLLLMLSVTVMDVGRFFG
jgi:regulator of sigma E protease